MDLIIQRRRVEGMGSVIEGGQLGGMQLMRYRL